MPLKNDFIQVRREDNPERFSAFLSAALESGFRIAYNQSQVVFTRLSPEQEASMKQRLSDEGVVYRLCDGPSPVLLLRTVLIAV